MALDRGDFAGALGLLDRAIAIEVAKLGPDHPSLAFEYINKAKALLALDRAFEITHDTVECYLDSELVVRQITGRYAVKSEKMARFLAEVRERLDRFHHSSFKHVPREHPRLQMADKLANRAIDEAKK